MTDLLDLQNIGPEEEAVFEPWMLQQVISWKKGYAESGGEFNFLNEDDQTVLTWIEGDGLYATPDDGTSPLGRVLVDTYHGFVGQIMTTAIDPSTLPLTWHVCDGSGGTPDLRRRFVLGVSGSNAVGTTGGAETVNTSNHAHGMTHNHAHSHTAGTLAGPSHTHGAGTYAGPSHTHTGPSHSHGPGSYAGPSHNHGAGSYAGPSHDHGPGSLANSSHGHGAGTYGISATGTTGNADHGVIYDEDETGNLHNTRDVDHDHSFSISAGVTGSSANNNANIDSGTTASSGTGSVTGTSGSGGTGSVTGTSDLDGTGATGSSGTGSVTGTSGSSGTGSVTGATDSDSTASSAANTGSAGAESLAILNPYYSLYHVMRVA